MVGLDNIYMYLIYTPVQEDNISTYISSCLEESIKEQDILAPPQFFNSDMKRCEAELCLCVDIQDM